MTLENWAFLIGEWEGETIETTPQDGDVRSTAVFDYHPSKKFIRGEFEAHNDKGLVNASSEYLYVDEGKGKFLRKSVFSYGFVNNEVERESNEGYILFDMNVEPNPSYFEGIVWRSFIRKIDDNTLEMGLFNSRDGHTFNTFNTSRYNKNE